MRSYTRDSGSVCTPKVGSSPSKQLTKRVNYELHSSLERRLTSKVCDFAFLFCEYVTRLVMLCNEAQRMVVVGCNTAHRGAIHTA